MKRQTLAKLFTPFQHTSKVHLLSPILMLSFIFCIAVYTIPTKESHLENAGFNDAKIGSETDTPKDILTDLETTTQDNAVVSVADSNQNSGNKRSVTNKAAPKKSAVNVPSQSGLNIQPISSVYGEVENLGTAEDLNAKNNVLIPSYQKWITLMNYYYQGSPDFLLVSYEPYTEEREQLRHTLDSMPLPDSMSSVSQARDDLYAASVSLCNKKTEVYYQAISINGNLNRDQATREILDELGKFANALINYKNKINQAPPTNLKLPSNGTNSLF